MADFASLGAVETWIKANIADGTIVNGYSARETLPGSTTDLCAIAQYPMSTASGATAGNGAWTKVYDNG